MTRWQPVEDMSEIPVTTVTRNASVDDLTDADYRDIYDEVRQLDPDTGNYAISLDKFVSLAHSIYSKALWSKYHNGGIELNRTMRSELRSAVGLDPLPATIAEATTAHLDPNAEVVAVGEGTGNRCIIIAEPQPLLISVNGVITAQHAPTPHSDRVTTVTRQRRDYWRPCLSPDLRERVESSGKSIDELLTIALEAL